MQDQDDKMLFGKRHRTILLLWLIFFLGMCIRVYNLGSHNLWFDEVASNVYLKGISFSRNIFWSLYGYQLYYILLKLLVMSFGNNEFVLRFVSMIFGSFSILIIYKLGKLFFNKKVALISAFIFSISPIHIWYSQEARVYSLSTFLTMLTVYFFILALKKNRFLWWVGFLLSSILAIYTNFFCLYTIIIVNILLFLKRATLFLKHYLVSSCIIFFVFLSFWPIFFQKLISIKNNFWVPKPHLNSIAITFENFNVGYNATPIIYFFTFIIFSLLFILGVQHWWQEKREELTTLILLIFIPIIFTYIISQKIPVYLDRLLMLFSPFYYIIIAAGLVRIKPPMLKTAAYLSILLPILLCLYNYFSYRMPLPQYHHIGVHVKKPFKPAVNYIKERFIEGDVVGFSEPSSAALFYYIPKLIREKIDIFSFVIKSKLDSYWRRYGEKEGYGLYITPPYYLDYLAYKNLHVIILDDERCCANIEGYDFKRLWLISSSWERDGNLNLHSQAVRQWIRTNYSILESKEFDGIFVGLYTKKIR